MPLAHLIKIIMVRLPNIQTVKEVELFTNQVRITLPEGKFAIRATTAREVMVEEVKGGLLHSNSAAKLLEKRLNGKG